MTKHTPGPWEVISGSLDIRAAGTDKRFIAEVLEMQVVGSNEPDNAVTANARLIAAAPNMLAALEKCEATFAALSEYFEGAHEATLCVTCYMVQGKVQEVIKKATQE